MIILAVNVMLVEGHSDGTFSSFLWHHCLMMLLGDFASSKGLGKG
jgi:hypothetical protein